MSKYTGPSNKLFRNFGVKDLSNRKLTTSMRQNASGQHGLARKKLSEYALHLKEKQKIRLTYLVSEKQFARYYNEGLQEEKVLRVLSFYNYWNQDLITFYTEQALVSHVNKQDKS